MSADPKASGGSPEVDPSGAADPNAIKDPSKDTVKYETFSKLLDEKKRLQAKFDELAREKSEAEASKAKQLEEELKAKDDWKKLAGIKDSKIKELEERLKSADEELGGLKGSVQNSIKLRAFLDKVNGQIERQYMNLIDTDQIVYDPSTGQIDESSLQKAVSDFEKTYPLVIKKPGGKLPNDAARGADAKLSYEAWLKLPYKEKLERQKDVV